MISVCLASYNGEKYIKEQLLSILCQLGQDDEVIISDDGSKDNTLSVVKELGDDRIHIYLNKANHGFTHNFENALKRAKGDYIFLSDQDDIWKENKVEVMMSFLHDFDLVTHDCVTVNENLEIIQESRFREFNIQPGFFRHLVKSRFLGCCLAFNRRVLETSLPFPKNDKLLEHDIWLVAVAMFYFKVKLVEEPLIFYRRHGENVSDGGFEKGYSISNKIVRRIYRVMCLLRIALKVRK